jgi:hypothetical protein
MAKIVDPDNLNQSTEVDFLSGSLQIRLNTAGNLSSDGVSLQTLYSFIKEEWKNDDNLIKFPFPMVSITTEQFEFINGWDLSGSATVSALDDTAGSWTYIKDGGWAVVNANGNNTQEWMNITTLGSFNAGTDQAYYYQTSSGDIRNTVLAGEVNQGIQILSSGSISGEEFDYKTFFKIYLREQGKVYAFYDLIAEQNLTTLTSRKFALPLANSLDLNIEANDPLIVTGSIYTGMSITYFTSSQAKDISGTSYNFKVVIDGNGGTKTQIYEWVQKQLRSGSGYDIDAGANIQPSVTGSVAEELLQFVGTNLKTKLQTDVGGSGAGGVIIENFAVADTNDLTFVDDTGTERVFDFVAAGTLNFNSFLQSDTDAIYKVFFTNDDAGDNTGRDFGTQDAIIIFQNDGTTPLTGSVATSASRDFDYNFDKNVQRGTDSSGSVVPFTGVAIGLGSAQYVVTTGTLTRSTTNAINFVAAQERNYSNPA